MFSICKNIFILLMVLFFYFDISFANNVNAKDNTKEEKSKKSKEQEEESKDSKKELKKKEVKYKKPYSGFHLGGGGGYIYIKGGDFGNGLSFEDVNFGGGGSDVGYIANINNFILDTYIFGVYMAAKDDLKLYDGAGIRYKYRTYGDYGLNMRFGYNIKKFVPYGFLGFTASPFELKHEGIKEDAVSLGINYGAGLMYSFGKKNKAYTFFELNMHSDLYTEVFGSNGYRNNKGLGFYLHVKMGGGTIF